VLFRWWPLRSKRWDRIAPQKYAVVPPRASTDCFYPDFVAVLKDGRCLAIRYQNVGDWSNDDSREERKIGELWEAASAGKCLFIMPRGPDWAAIEAKVKTS
jgi:type III restriction enzyme